MTHRQPAVCVLTSGGLDSAVLVGRFLARGARVLPLYMRCGLRWERAELAAARRLLRRMRSRRLLPLAVADLPVRPLYGNHWSLTGRSIPGAASDDRAVFLPGRNLLLASQAAIVSARQGISTVALGILKSNPFGDATPRFFSSLERSLSLALGRSIRILTPLRTLTKPELIRAGNGLPFELTVSCLRPSRAPRRQAGSAKGVPKRAARGRPIRLLHCGACNKCAERRRAFRAARVPDPTRYAK